MHARLVFNAVVQQYYVPGIQIGTKIMPNGDGLSIDEAFSVERWVTPACNCLWCANMISSYLLAVEAKSADERRDQDYGTQQVNPSVITMNAVGAGLAVNDFMMSYLGLYKDSAVVSPRRIKHSNREIVDEVYPGDPNCSECSASDGARLGMGDAMELPTLAR
jgi:hypothetical protein